MRHLTEYLRKGLLNVSEIPWRLSRVSLLIMTDEESSTDEHGDRQNGTPVIKPHKLSISLMRKGRYKNTSYKASISLHISRKLSK